MLPNDLSKHEEYKQKLSNASRGRTPSIETRKKLSLVHKGKRFSDDHRRKISIAVKARWSDPEERKKFSDLRRKQYQENPEYRKKIGDSHRGEKHPFFGKHLPEETRRKLSIANSGENAYQWKGGISFEPYCPKFNDEFKERVRAFFDNKCIECGKAQNSRKLDVHHVDFNKETCCDNSVPLFVPLCQQCHGKTQTSRESWEQHFIQIINDKYGGRCYLPKAEVA